ncbi:MAG: DUF503 domain-containing protein [Candidatus Marinimicrobia bacterium]|nr:DUF503 domain-containing protein [Candidatus Neomarinimicrobiota bacterium]
MSVIIGHLSLELHFPLAHSLKEKRKSLKRIKEKVTHRFNVSLIESAYQDKWQRSKIDIAIIGIDQQAIENTIQNILHLIDEVSIGEIQTLSAEIEWH